MPSSGTPEALSSAAEVAAATSDSLVRWAAQALTPSYPYERGAAWRLGGAVAVFGPRLYRRDRLVLAGDGADAAELVARVTPDLPGVRTLSASPLAATVASAVPSWRPLASFGWMDLAQPVVASSAGVDWLAEGAHDAVTCLLRKANPEAYVFPGDPGARRWAGVPAQSGELVSVAADAWPAPDVGLVGGVATHPDHRGQGLSTAVCAFVADRLYRRHGAVALMVDGDNPAAIRVYSRLNFRYRSVTVLAAEDSTAASDLDDGATSTTECGWILGTGRTLSPRKALS